MALGPPVPSSWSPSFCGEGRRATGSLMELAFSCTPLRCWSIQPEYSPRCLHCQRWSLLPKPTLPTRQTLRCCLSASLRRPMPSWQRLCLGSSSCNAGNTTANGSRSGNGPKRARHELPGGGDVWPRSRRSRRVRLRRDRGLALRLRVRLRDPWRGDKVGKPYTRSATKERGGIVVRGGHLWTRGEVELAGGAPDMRSQLGASTTVIEFSAATLFCTMQWHFDICSSGDPRWHGTLCDGPKGRSRGCAVVTDAPAALGGRRVD